MDILSNRQTRSYTQESPPTTLSIGHYSQLCCHATVSRADTLEITSFNISLKVLHIIAHHTNQIDCIISKCAKTASHVRKFTIPVEVLEGEKKLEIVVLKLEFLQDIPRLTP